MRHPLDGKCPCFFRGVSAPSRVEAWGSEQPQPKGRRITFFEIAWLRMMCVPCWAQMRNMVSEQRKLFLQYVSSICHGSFIVSIETFSFY